MQNATSMGQNSKEVSCNSHPHLVSVAERMRRVRQHMGEDLCSNNLFPGHSDGKKVLLKKAVTHTVVT